VLGVVTIVAVPVRVATAIEITGIVVVFDTMMVAVAPGVRIGVAVAGSGSRW
jgi:hypothetical protein